MSNNLDLYSQITDQMLQRSRIISLQQMHEVNEGSENLPPAMHVVYENGQEEWIKGEAQIRSFINGILSTR